MKVPTRQQYVMNETVMDHGAKIAQAARIFAVSPSTVRRAMDAVSDFERATFKIELSGAEMKEVLGWLRNGNTTSKDLADRIQANVEGTASNFRDYPEE